MPTRRKTWMLLWSLLVLLFATATACVWLLTIPAPIESWLQERVLQALREHYHADVQLQNLRVTLIPSFRATADDFLVPNRGGPGLPPLITVKHLTAQAGLLELLRTPVHISWVELDGLTIQVIPKRDSATGSPVEPRRHLHLANFVIDKVEADETALYILRKDPGKEPMKWDIRKLRLRSAGIGQAMKFQAELTNPTPPGVIQTTGHVGPWVFDEPSDTAVDGHYNFRHADLSVFSGISGILSSSGDYTGTLHDIVVDGTTDVPDFRLDQGGQAVHLTAKFHAIVDGTNGNTYLRPVNAHFLKSDVSVVKGEVASKAGQKGKTVALDIDLRDARVQDALALASKAEPPMLTGRLQLEAQLTIPRGNKPVLQKMLLQGRFHVSEAQFANDKMKAAITELSRRGQGKPTDLTIQDAPAEFMGDFQLATATMSFGKLQFAVPGVTAEMKGGYGLTTEQLDFSGDVRLDAHVSQTMTGVKRVVLVPFDPIFMKHAAGTYLPVNITGTRSQPQIKVNWKKLF
jgi:hypothetical protein